MYIAAGCRWHLCNTNSDLVDRVAYEIGQIANEAITTRQKFLLVAAGGDTPRLVYKKLTAHKTEWQAWHIYFSDERFLPATDPGRNSVMVGETLLVSGMIPPAQVHVIPAELGTRQAAMIYQTVIDPIDQFDLVLLGLGEDGHVAGLFPGRDVGATIDTPSVIAVADAPKPPSERVSLTHRRLALTRRILFMISGSAKRAAVRDWLNGRSTLAAKFSADEGVDVFVDTDAWPE